MTDRGTRSAAQVLSSRNVVPQERRRLYIVCFRIDNEACSRRDPLSEGVGGGGGGGGGGGQGCADRFEWPARLTADPAQLQPPPPTVRDILEPEGSPALAACTVQPQQWAKIQQRERANSGSR
eukprot:COSAG01_NODE_11530_length_1913_cov_1.345094_2_plen_122_part_01